jgi:ribonuclease VapC
MIVIDSSAIVAILKQEPEADALSGAMAAARSRVMSAVNYVELGTVLAGRRKSAREQTADDLDVLLGDMDVEVHGVTPELARAALRARIKYGKGFGLKKGLNFGDCFAYALARAENAPLLFVGDDFTRTDIESAL